MAEGSHGGHLKLILAIVLVAGILGLIVYANTGQKFLSVFKSGKFTQTQAPTAEPFSIALTSSATVLYGKSFAIASSPFSFQGVCSLIEVGGLKIESDETRCSASADSFSGTFQYTPFGSIVFTGSANGVKIDSKKYSSNAAISVEFEVIPTDFSVAGISENTISLIVPSGKIERYAKDGSLKGVAYLTQSTLDISTLVAYAQLANGELTISGTTTSVKSNEFSW